MAEALPFPWDAFEELQRATDNNTRMMTPRSRGADEALTTLLDGWVTRGFPSSLAELERKSGNLRTNRSAKYRRRIDLDREGAIPADDAEDKLETGVFWKQLAAVATADLQPRDRLLLDEVTADVEYAQLAAERSMTTGALKTRVSRLRRRVRQGSRATWIRDLLRQAA